MSSSNPASLLTGLPEEFGVLYRYARTLQFTDLPDYEGLRQLFRGLAEREGFLDSAGEYDGVWDWDAPDGSVPPVPSTPPAMGHGQGRFCEACNKRAAEAAGVPTALTAVAHRTRSPEAAQVHTRRCSEVLESTMICGTKRKHRARTFPLTRSTRPKYSVSIA